jgi:hypothetical protein
MAGLAGLFLLRGGYAAKPNFIHNHKQYHDHAHHAEPETPVSEIHRFHLPVLKRRSLGTKRYRGTEAPTGRGPVSVKGLSAPRINIRHFRGGIMAAQDTGLPGFTDGWRTSFTRESGCAVVDRVPLYFCNIASTNSASVS